MYPLYETRVLLYYLYWQLPLAEMVGFHSRETIELLHNMGDGHDSHSDNYDMPHVHSVP